MNIKFYILMDIGLVWFLDLAAILLMKCFLVCLRIPYLMNT